MPVSNEFYQLDANQNERLKSMLSSLTESNAFENKVLAYLDNLTKEVNYLKDSLIEDKSLIVTGKEVLDEYERLFK